MKIAMVWDRPAPDALEYGAHIGTQSLHLVVGCGAVWWPDGIPEAGVWDGYDAYIVNLFPDMHHVTDLRAARPDALIVALPDAYFDEVFVSRNAEQEANFMRQLKAADMIGWVSESNRQFYSVFDKPMVRIPMPIGTPEFFADMRTLPKEDFIITCDHSPRVVEYTIQNVAANALIQRETGLRVVYANPGPQTRFYAEQLGLEADFLPYMTYERFVELAARAKIGVDLYARHGFGRNELTLAYAGTPYIASNYTQKPGNQMFIDPWWAAGANALAKKLLTEDYALFRGMGLTNAEANYSFKAVRRQWEKVKEALETCRSAQYS